MAARDIDSDLTGEDLFSRIANLGYFCTTKDDFHVMNNHREYHPNKFPAPGHCPAPSTATSSTSPVLPAEAPKPRQILGQNQKGIATRTRDNPFFVTISSRESVAASMPLEFREVVPGKPKSRKYRREEQMKPMMCNFCKNNREVRDIYLTHYLYDPVTKILSCPILRKHICQVCGDTGDYAHTLKYCRLNRAMGQVQGNIPNLLHNSITNSAGRIRRL